MDLFNYNLDEKISNRAPLADKMRPQKLETFVGQEHILGEDKLLRRAIEADRISSLIFYGPPGSGKTTLAKIIANYTQKEFYQLNAVTSGVKEIREIVDKAKELRSQHLTETILFIDEIHRFNKAQQDALLPYVENGLLILIGATTENPYFTVNNPLLSRSQIFRLKALNLDEMKLLVERALSDPKNGLGNYQVEIDEEAIDHLINTANGDIRVAYNALELAVLTTKPNVQGTRVINRGIIEDSIQQKAVYYDKDGDEHYNVISAFIKSLRGSDPDAGLYWLSRMIYAGEDPLFIARRMLIFASEDVGNADPNALQVALSVFQAVERIGLPEGKISLAQGATYLASVPKSNSSYMALLEAEKEIDEGNTGPVPIHLKDTHYEGAKKMGYGKGYAYPHSYQDNFVNQNYFPEGIERKIFYRPTVNGREKEFKARLERLWQRKRGE